MRITQVFASADDERVISELEISPDQATSVPVEGDRVRWVVNNRVYTGRVTSRLISYSPPNNIELESAKKVNIRAVLSVRSNQRKHIRTTLPMREFCGSGLNRVCRRSNRPQTKQARPRHYTERARTEVMAPRRLRPCHVGHGYSRRTHVGQILLWRTGCGTLCLALCF